MGRSAILIISMLFVVAGCSGLYQYNQPARTLSDEQVAQLRAEIQEIGDRCKKLRLSGRLSGFVASVQCSNPGIRAAYEKVDFQYSSILNLALAERLLLAERVDAKKISEGDMLVEFYSEVRSLPAIPNP
jgi:hypothetical protein